MDNKNKEHIEFLFIDQRKARGEKGEFSIAHKLLDDIEEKLNGYPREECLLFWSRHSYEKAFMLNIEGEFDKAAKWFKHSGQYAKDNGDMLRGLIGDFRYALTLYLAEKMSPEETYKTFLEIYEEHNNLQTIALGDKGLQKSSHFNLLKRLAEVSFELSSNDCEYWSRSIMDHEFMIASELDFNPMYEVLRWKIQTRIDMMNGHFEKAAGIFAAYLDIDIPNLTIDARVQNPQDIRNFAHEKTEEIARDYRDFGRVLNNCTTLPDYHELAIKVWKRGLEIPNIRGNHRFLEDIKKDSKLKR